MEHITETQINYFKSKISPPNENGCMLWTGCLDKDGYGQIKFGNYPNVYRIKSHRFSLWLVEKPTNKKLWACHKPVICHTVSCCNPNHLYWGTPKTNTDDQKLDNTLKIPETKGNKNGNAILNEYKVLEIKKLLN